MACSAKGCAPVVGSGPSERADQSEVGKARGGRRAPKSSWAGMGQHERVSTSGMATWQDLASEPLKPCKPLSSAPFGLAPGTPDPRRPRQSSYLTSRTPSASPLLYIAGMSPEEPFDDPRLNGVASNKIIPPRNLLFPDAIGGSRRSIKR